MGATNASFQFSRRRVVGYVWRRPRLMADYLAIVANLFTVVLGMWALWQIVLSETRRRRRARRKADRNPK